MCAVCIQTVTWSAKKIQDIGMADGAENTYGDQNELFRVQSSSNTVLLHLWILKDPSPHTNLC